MEQIIPQALERIENPILIILLAVLLAGVVAMWRKDLKKDAILRDLLVESIGAIKDINTTLLRLKDADQTQHADIAEKLEEIQRKIETALR